MGQDKAQEIFEEKYQRVFGVSFAQWQQTAPQTEDQAYARLNEIDRELNRTYDVWFEAKGEEKDRLEDYRDKLKAEYDFLEAVFNLEAPDKDW